MKKIFGIMALLAVAVMSMAGCGSVSYTDGSYTGQSEVYVAEGTEQNDASNGYGVATVTIKDGKISDCTFEAYEVDGTLKDEEYGKEDGEIRNQDYYNKAQKATAACAQYAADLVAKGNVDDVDVISGATINYNEFKEAVNNALDGAQQ